MTREDFFRTIADYNQLIRQKGFNKHACNDAKLEEIKKILIKDIAIQIAMIERDLSSRDCLPDCNESDASVYKVDMMDLKYLLISLQQKIFLGYFLSMKDYEGAFYEVKKIPFGVKLFAVKKYNFCNNLSASQLAPHDEVMYYAMISDYNTLLEKVNSDQSALRRAKAIGQTILLEVECNITAIEQSQGMDALEIEDNISALTKIRDCVQNQEPIPCNFAKNSYYLSPSKVASIVSAMAFGSLLAI